ncbi:MAG: ferredoxin, partial [Acidilobus sp.]|nr:ferredoxin [Acidilobus sp.]
MVCVSLCGDVFEMS